MKQLAAAAVVLLLCAACDQGQKPGTGGADTAAATTSAALSDEEVDKADIPVAEDFEDEANKQITEDNADDELAKLEKEIGSGQ